MWYVLEDTVPANTTRANARETSIKVHGRILHTIFVTIPPGAADQAHLQLRQASYYILPRNEDKSMTGEHASTNYREWYSLKAERNTLTLRTWNTSQLNTHHVRLLLGVLPKAVLEVEEQYLKTLQLFMKLFRRRS